MTEFGETAAAAVLDALVAGLAVIEEEATVLSPPLEAMEEPEAGAAYC